MTGVENKFAELKKAGKKGLIIYITAGIPDADSTVQLVLEAEKAPPVLLPLYFRLRLAGALGFAPNLGQCGRCGRTISEDALFVVDEGQLRCSSCRSSRFELERYGVEIPAQGLDLLRHVQQSFPSGWPDGELPPPVRRACARAIDGFVQYHLGLAWEGNYFRRV